MLDLWMIRHGESKWNTQGRTQGQHPSKENGLTELGIRQAKALKKRLELEAFDIVYSSDLPRALETASLCFPDLEIQQDARLREIHRAGLAAKTHDERSEEERKTIAFIKENRFLNRPPKGENFQDVMLRVEDWLKDLPESGKIIVFTHGGVIRSVLALFIEFKQARYFDLDNTGITELKLSKDKTRVLRVNDCAHLGAFNG